MFHYLCLQRNDNFIKLVITAECNNAALQFRNTINLLFLPFLNLCKDHHKHFTLVALKLFKET